MVCDSESNSQRTAQRISNYIVVQNIKDTNFWKQFTTDFYNIHFTNSLFRISKIQTFESNSQRRPSTLPDFFSCSEYQRYKLLKAIHNEKPQRKKSTTVVQNIKDTNFWKQFTTAQLQETKSRWLFRISKIQTFESNSQRKIKSMKIDWCCSEYQRYKLLKAIHNGVQGLVGAFTVVQNIKDTNFWKQFTTGAWK